MVANEVGELPLRDLAAAEGVHHDRNGIGHSDGIRELHLDFAGSGPQSPGDLNVVWLALLATVYYALKAILDPTIPANGCFYRAIEVAAP